MGCIGLKYDEFCGLEFEEFSAIYEQYITQKEAEYKDSWQQTRMLALLIIRPFLDKKSNITAKKLLPFPWEKETKSVKAKEVNLTPKQQKERMERLVEKLGDEIIGTDGRKKHHIDHV